jgi:hypothetical protein
MGLGLLRTCADSRQSQPRVPQSASERIEEGGRVKGESFDHCGTYGTLGYLRLARTARASFVGKTAVKRQGLVAFAFARRRSQARGTSVRYLSARQTIDSPYKISRGFALVNAGPCARPPHVFSVLRTASVGFVALVRVSRQALTVRRSKTCSRPC